MGDKTAMFEKSFARYLGCPHAVMVNSGSSADLLLAFAITNPESALLHPGDEIVIPAVTWPTQLWAPLMAGLKVSLADIDPTTFNISAATIERACSPRTKAVFLVHLLGNPCEMDCVMSLARDRNLLILEDVCEALGSTWEGQKLGTFGFGAAFSFFFSHHITTMEGGMVTLKDALHADHVRMLRAHGWMRDVSGTRSSPVDIDPRYVFMNWGFNVRPTEVQAAFGLHQLQKLPTFNARRSSLATQFWTFIDEAPHLRRPIVSPKAECSWFALPLLIDRDAPFSRLELTNYLEAQGVETRPIVAGNLARQPAARIIHGISHGDLAGADEIHERAFYIGLSPMVESQTMARLIDCLKAFLALY